MSPSAPPTNDGWCANDIPSDTPRRTTGTASDCVSDLQGGTKSWLIDGVTTRLVNRGLIDTATQELCIIQHGDTYEWAIVSGGFIYPTCVQSGAVNAATLTLVLNAEGGQTTNLNRQANQLQNQRVFERNNYMAFDCPPVQSYCSISQDGTDVITNWFISQVEIQVATYGGSLEENWGANVCIGDDKAIRYITASEIVNTCTGFTYDENIVVQDQHCTYNSWECGFKTFSPFEYQSPSFPVNLFRTISQALMQPDYTYPQCSFKDGNYCQIERLEQRVQPRYTDKTLCVDSSHPQYDNSIASVLTRINVKDTRTGDDKPVYDLCYMEDNEGDLQYVLFVDGIGYPTCVSSPRDICPTDKLWCVEAARKNWPNTVASRLLDGRVYGSADQVGRHNHQHWECPTILDICLPGTGSTIPGGLTNFQKTDIQPGGVSDPVLFEDNVCVGAMGGIRVVTSQGIQPTCVGFSWDTAGMGSGQEQNKMCPATRNFMCGSLQKSTGEKVFGWLTPQTRLVRFALSQPDFKHPDCPYDACRDC